MKLRGDATLSLRGWEHVVDLHLGLARSGSTGMPPKNPPGRAIAPACPAVSEPDPDQYVEAIRLLRGSRLSCPVAAELLGMPSLAVSAGAQARRATEPAWTLQL